ncbi:unnamed protein product, partial [Candidula unifasciata]
MVMTATRHRGKMFSLILIAMTVFLQPSQQSTNTPPPPQIVLGAIDVQTNEVEDRRVMLGPAPLVSCTDEDPARATIQSISPNSQCGLKCLSLEPCPGGSNTSEFCLFYVPGQGKYNYASVPQYNLIIACTDDVEKPTAVPLIMRIAPNTPPDWDPSTPIVDTKTVSATTLKAGVPIYTLRTKDIDDDAVYYTMTTDPNTPYLNIGYANGEITSNTDGRFICTDKIRAMVTATDKHNPPIGPYRVDFTFNPTNTVPYVSNLDATVTINENVGVGFTAYDIKVIDPVESSRLTVTMRSQTDSGMEQYTFEPNGKGGTVKTKRNPNFEQKDTQRVTLYFDVDDGFCKANKTYSLTINTADVNEQPTLYPSTLQSLEVYEGYINIPTGLQIFDEDTNDKCTFSSAGGSKEFAVDKDTGNIYSVGEIDIDKNTPFKKFNQMVKCTDEGGKTTTSNLDVVVYDANDQYPIFNSNSFTFAATECTPLGTELGKVAGKDDDSSHNHNNFIYYGGGAGKVTVMAKGSVVLTQPCVNGETSTGTATIADEGIYPGPLTGTPATISFKCGPCPPPPPPPQPAPPATPAPAVTTTTTTTKKPTVTTKAPTKTTRTKEDDSTSILLSWLIPAILGGLVWLALTAFLIYRYCCPCRNPCAGFCRR